MIRKLLNPKANPNNSLKLLKSQSGCCDDDTTVCKYTFTQVSEIVVRGIKVTEGDDTVTTMLADVPGGSDMITAYGALGTNAEKVQYLKSTIFPALFQAAGYVSEAQSDIVVSADLKSIVITGEAELTAITTSAPADITPTVACVKIAICDYCANFAGSATAFEISVGGTDYTLTPTAETDFVYPTGLSELQTQLEAELDGNVLGYSAVDDADNETFVITITEPVGTAVVINGVTAECCDVRNDFKA